MSKLIEALKAGSKEFERKTEHQLTQEQLADIYFSGGDKVKKTDYPLVIKVVEKPRAGSLVPWIISSLALLLMAFSLFSTKRIFVDIKVIDEKNPYLAGFPSALPAPVEPVATVTHKGISEKSEKMNAESFIFEGAAKLKSSKDKSTLTLVNSSVAPFAQANLYLNTPINLSDSKIVFYAKGQKGGENLAVAIKDRDNVTAFEKGRLFPFPDTLSTEWQMAEIFIDGSVKNFDERKVASIRFEFGTKEVRNKPGDTIFIKDVRVVPV